MPLAPAIDSPPEPQAVSPNVSDTSAAAASASGAKRLTRRIINTLLGWIRSIGSC